MYDNSGDTSKDGIQTWTPSNHKKHPITEQQKRQMTATTNAKARTTMDKVRYDETKSVKEDDLRVSKSP